MFQLFGVCCKSASAPQECDVQAGWPPKITGLILGVFEIKIMLYWGLFWGPEFCKLPIRGSFI